MVINKLPLINHDYHDYQIMLVFCHYKWVLGSPDIGHVDLTTNMEFFIRNSLDETVFLHFQLNFCTKLMPFHFI